MRLRWSPTSPFVRKVVVTMKEKGIEDLVEKEKSNPLSREDRAATPNPLGKVPCLITSEGTAIYDSPVIMEYLDTEFDGPRLLPVSGPERWTALRRQALADGMIEAMVACFVESLRKPERQSAGFLKHNRSVALAGVTALESEVDDLVDRIDLGTISAAVALSYVSKAFPDQDWRGENQKLANWFGEFEQRPSMRESALVDARDFR